MTPYNTRVLIEYIPAQDSYKYHYRSKSVNKEIGMKALSVYEQARPSAVLAPCRIAQWTTQTIHHHLGDCSWVTLPGYSADLVCTDVGHCHALACTYTYSYTYTMLKVLHGHVFP